MNNVMVWFFGNRRRTKVAGVRHYMQVIKIVLKAFDGVEGRNFMPIKKF